MPFELGIDYACRLYYRNGREEKRVLILEEQRYRYQAALSDIAGWDIEDHAGDYQRAVRKVRNWLVGASETRADGPKRILDQYADFQGWNWERLRAEGWSEEDIKELPTPEFLNGLRLWMQSGRPL
jgi:hypothetical protein